MRASSEIRNILADEGFKVIDLGVGKAPCLQRDGAADDTPYVYLMAHQGDREFYNSRWEEADSFSIVCFNPSTLEELANDEAPTLEAAIIRARTMLAEHAPEPASGMRL